MANNKVYTDYLMHGRTKGSKNGISTTPGYTAVGQKARGHYVNGHYVYYEDEAKQRAFRQGKAEARGRNSAYENQAMVKRMENARKADVQDQKIYGKKKEGYTRLADISPYERQRLANKYLENNHQHQTAVNQHNAEVVGKNAALAYAQKQKAKKPTNIGASQAGDTARAMKEHDTEKKAQLKAVLERDSLAGKTYGHMNVDPSKSVLSNQWQRHGEKARNRQMHGDASVGHKSWEEEQRDTTNKYISEEKMKSKQPNAMAGDSRYHKKENAMKNDPRYIAGNKKPFNTRQHLPNDYTGKYSYDAPVMIPIVGKPEKMPRDPYWNQYKAATNNQEVAKAQAKYKEFMNDFRKSKERNSRSDIGNAFADAKEDAKNLFKKLKSKFKKKRGDRSCLI